MLREIAETRQILGEARRRWFHSESMDLYVWYDAADAPLGFQLCYGKPMHERALTWFRPDAYSHMAVDLRRQSTPILVADGFFDQGTVVADFTNESRDLPAEIVSLVVARLGEYP